MLLRYSSWKLIELIAQKVELKGYFKWKNCQMIDFKFEESKATHFSFSEYKPNMNIQYSKRVYK